MLKLVAIRNTRSAEAGSNVGCSTALPISASSRATTTARSSARGVGITPRGPFTNSWSLNSRRKRVSARLTAGWLIFNRRAAAVTLRVCSTV